MCSLDCSEKMDPVQRIHVSKTQRAVMDVELHRTNILSHFLWEKALGFIANHHLDLNITQSFILSLNIQSNMSTNIEVTYLCDTDEIGNEVNESFRVHTSKRMVGLSKVERKQLLSGSSV